MTRYLLDTNVIYEVRKLRPHGGLLTWIAGLREEQLCLSAVTLGELQAGVEHTRRYDVGKANEIEQWVDRLSQTYQVLPMDEFCCREWGRLKGNHPDRMMEDLMIAATARVHRLIVATRNERDFSSVDITIVNPFK